MIGTNLEEAFLEAHNEWCSHFDADGDKYIFAPGTVVKLCGLQNREELNGSTGIVKCFLPEKDRFRVGICDGGASGSGTAAVNVRAQNLQAAVASAGSFSSHPLQDGSPPPPPPVTSLPSLEEADADALRAAFFMPGMRYFGTIQIPGDAGYRIGADVIGCRQTYELTITGSVSSCAATKLIVDEIENVLGHVICARHRAYDDEQYVFITISEIEHPVPVSVEDSSATSTRIAPAAAFTMQYSDAETTCTGRWDPALGMFKGTVSQKIHSAEKIFEKSDPITHTFDLYPCHHSETHSRHASCTNIESSGFQSRSHHRAACTEALEQCLNRFQEMSSTLNTNTVTNMGNFYLYLRDKVRWKILLDTASLLTERSCAYIRLLSTFINELEFDNPSARKNRLEFLELQGVSRSKVHYLCDKSFTLLGQALTWWYHIHPHEVTSATAVHVARYRLDKSYELFSEALSSASVRVTEITMDTFARTAADFLGKYLCDKSQDTGMDEACCICMDSLVYNSDIIEPGSAGDKPLMLPCSHSFHGGCIRSWLRFHSNCPMCRVFLIEEEDGG